MDYDWRPLSPAQRRKKRGTLIRSTLQDISTAHPDSMVEVKEIKEEFSGEEIIVLRDDLVGIMNGHIHPSDSSFGHRIITLSDRKIFARDEDSTLFMTVEVLKNDDEMGYSEDQLLEDICVVLSDDREDPQSYMISEYVCKTDASSIVLSRGGTEYYKVLMHFQGGMEQESVTSKLVGFSKIILEGSGIDVAPFMRDLSGVLKGMENTSVFMDYAFKSLNRTQDDLSRYGVKVLLRDTHEFLFNIDISTFDDQGTSKSDVEEALLDILRGEEDPEDTLFLDCDTQTAPGGSRGFLVDLQEGSSFLFEFSGE